MRIVEKKFLIIIVPVLILFYLILDFTNFYKSINSFKNNQNPPFDLVVLTGGTNRIKQTLDVFFIKFSRKHRLLISGAGKGFNKSIVSKLLSKHKEPDQIINCCINIENTSVDTRTNALETRKWINKHKIKSFALITSNYHMPRALVEFKKISKGIVIIPYVLEANNNEGISKYKIFIVEYLKFLIARIHFF